MTLGKKNPPVFYWIIVSMIIKVKLDKIWRLLVPDAIFSHPVCQDRRCLASNIMGVLRAIFNSKGLDGREALCKLAVSSAWSLLKLQLSFAGWILCFSHRTCVKSRPLFARWCRDHWLLRHFCLQIPVYKFQKMKRSIWKLMQES